MKYFILFITVATCTDGIKNGNETDVDCGSSCIPQKNAPTLWAVLVRMTARVAFVD